MYVLLPSATIYKFEAELAEVVYSSMSQLSQFASFTIKCYQTDRNEYTDLQMQIFTH